MKPEFITFTGVDDDTDPAGLVQLANDYPVEFGLLFSPKRQGLEPRYPKLSTIAWLVQELPLRYAAHLCGGDARAWLDEDRCEHDLRGFQRVQINTANPNIQPSLIGNQAAKRNLRAILQCRGDFPHVASVDVLFDASGGRGIEAKAWPAAARTTFCGYAGGLKPENVAEAVRIIGQQGVRYWIDMESGVRDERDRFSLEKCRAVCAAVYGVPASDANDPLLQHVLSNPRPIAEIQADIAAARGRITSGVSVPGDQTFSQQTPMDGKATP